jgi:teichuronic acid biosynthesis glycosyltransferase TuaC
MVRWENMKILIVCSGNWGYVKPFIREQVEALKNAGVDCDYFLIHGKGFWGYLKNYQCLRKEINEKKYNLVHAHYGLSGLLAVMQRKVPTVVSFHGIDLIDKKSRFTSTFLISKFHVFLSKTAARYSAWNIFVNKNIIVFPQKEHTIISCGVDISLFYPLEKKECRKKLQIEENKRYILFGSSFDQGKWKNNELARSTVSMIPNAELIEMKNFSREQVNLWMNACDLLLVTSFFETGPQVVKEAMACNFPIVSTDVGDVKDVIRNTDGCFICSYDQKEVAEKIMLTFAFGKRTNGREKILNYNNKVIAEKVIDVYKKVIGNR